MDERAWERAGAVMTRALREAQATQRPLTRADALRALVLARKPRRVPGVRARVVASAGARIEVYDEIGPWGVTAAWLIRELRDAGGAVDLRVNSPGGDVYDALAIYNALKDHAGYVTVTVDGLAASAASFIAMAGDRVVMNRGSQMMIHDASTLTYGNEEEHLRSAELLGKVSDTLAEIYAARAGGTSAAWRTRMKAETWFSAQESVDVKLADAVVADEPADAAASALARKVRAALS